MISRSDSSSLLGVGRALSLESLVIGLLAARLVDLDVAVLLLEATSVFLVRKHFVDKSPLAVLVVNSGREVLGRTLDDGTNLRVLRRSHLSVVLLVVPVRVEHITHLEKLKISLQFWCQIGAGHVEPLLSGRRLLRLRKKMSAKFLSD